MAEGHRHESRGELERASQYPRKPGNSDVIHNYSGEEDRDCSQYTVLFSARLADLDG